jgi:hypothetical protein
MDRIETDASHNFSLPKERLYRVVNLATDGKMIFIYILQSKVIPVRGRGGPQGCETSRPPHFLDNRLTDGGEIGRVIHVTGPGGAQGSKSSRLPHFLENRLTDGGEIGTVILVTGRGGPQGSETSRLPHFLENRLTDGGEIR